MPLPWSRNLQQCHPSSNFKNWYTHQFPLENQLHIKCSFRVNFITLCHGVPNIAIRSIVSDCIACFFFALQRSPYLFGYVFRVHCVDHIPNRESQTFHVLYARTIKIICNSNQSNTQKWKHRFDIVSCFQIVATKAREVFHHDALDFLLPHIVHQAGKCRPLEICSRKSIVEVGIHIAQFPAAVDIVLHQCDLRFHAFFCFFILNRKPPSSGSSTEAAACSGCGRFFLLFRATVCTLHFYPTKHLFPFIRFHGQADFCLSIVP